MYLIDSTLGFESRRDGFETKSETWLKAPSARWESVEYIVSQKDLGSEEFRYCDCIFNCGCIFKTVAAQDAAKTAEESSKDEKQPS
ncbi:hypothetical protein CEXT_710891 [Caerostris extrusa]|uniref:Uncharacterized protein n=1 Tax=Caerostris extrusa TaxID=172846 RepID=A0AAV4TL51_CAEEX|nr:hypothetical protein CEXT_710891 [Caerostris extrusa]